MGEKLRQLTELKCPECGSESFSLAIPGTEYFSVRSLTADSIAAAHICYADAADEPAYLFCDGCMTHYRIPDNVALE
jgi:hypothetical protein